MPTLKSRRLLPLHLLVAGLFVSSVSLAQIAPPPAAQPDARPRLRPLNAQSGNARTGPAVGAHIPVFEAIDLQGRRQTFASLKGPKGLVLAFSRSADWCPYCKTQLADLNSQVEAFRKRGLNVASLTYDSVDVLKEFAGRIGIKYTMLSDPQSQVIRAFDILNPKVEKGTRYEGIPFPGTYVLNEKGVITAKYFDDDYRERITAASIVTRQFGDGGSARTTVENSQVKLTYYASDTAPAPGHRMTLVIEVEPKAKMHVYAPGVQRYLPIDWTMAESNALLSFPVSYPASHMLNMPVIQETVPVYDKSFRLIRDVAVGLEPEIASSLGADRTLTAEGSFRYQACDDRECYLPKTIPLKWTFQIGKLDTTRVREELQKK